MAEAPAVEGLLEASDVGADPAGAPPAGVVRVCVEQRAGARASEAPLPLRLVAEGELEQPAVPGLDAASAQFDLLGQHVHAAVVAAQHELDVARDGRVAAEDRARRAVGDRVAHQRLVRVRGGQHPVVVRRQSEQPHVPAVALAVAQLEPVLLLGKQLRGVTTRLDPGPARVDVAAA
jgi:hypothetical protein